MTTLQAPAPSARGVVASGGSRSRIAFFALLACALALIALSVREPWWFLRLYAPQYPHGLTLVVGLDGFSGDVREIDMLNHYIGMAPLNDAASLERQVAPYAVVLLILGLVALAVWVRPAASWLLPVLGALFPVGFVADCMFWMVRYGHQLDPRAPLQLPPFTPELFGNGTIGQFMTFARPERGFWLAVLAVVLLAAASFVRMRQRSTLRAES